VLLLKIADDYVLGEQEHLRQQGEAGEVLLLQIALVARCWDLPASSSTLLDPQQTRSPTPIRSRAGGATTLWASSSAEVGVMPWTSGSRARGALGASPGNLGEEHAGKVDRARGVGRRLGEEDGRGKSIRDTPILGVSM
jgi:hypothetical protein